MAEWTRLCSKSELPETGEAREFPLGERMVCVANVTGSYLAMDNVCLHQGGPLGQGVIVRGKVVCPWHGWAYDPATGELDRRPGQRVQIYPIKLDGEDVLVQV